VGSVVGAGGDELCATLLFEAVEGGLCLLEVLEALEVVEVM
jgi:hypothetical protein